MDRWNPDVTVIVATHKRYQMPEDTMYLPLHVGAEGKKDEDGAPLDLGYRKDNTGEHISEKNSRFCELTGLYWAWKNIDADAVGLVHYRRYFSMGRKAKEPFQNILTYDETCRLLQRYKIIVPKKRHYIIETLYSHYAHTHYEDHLHKTRHIIEENYPDYIEDFDHVMKQRSGHMFNMMIMKKDLLDQYCEWLFTILFKLETQIDNKDLSAFQERFCGRISEIIFNVWIRHQVEHGIVKKEEIRELPYIYMEKINWPRKILLFLKAKMIHQKYDRSF